MSTRLLRILVLAIFTLLAALFFPIPAKATANHCGALSGSETWSRSANVHVISCSVTVPVGVTLNIEAGAIVKFELGTRLTVNGTIHAVGTDSYRIFFTSIRDDLVGGDTNNDGFSTSPAKGNWTWIAFGPDSQAQFDYATFRYSGGTVGTGNHASLFAQSFVIPVVGDHVLFENNWNNGIEIPAGSIPFSPYQFPHYAAAAYFIRESLTVPEGATVTIAPGAVLKFNLGKGLLVNGTLNATGAAAEQIYFTSILDDEAGGDTNADGLATSPAVGNWTWIRFGPNSSTVFDDATMRYSGGVVGTGNHAVLYAEDYVVPEIGDGVVLEKIWVNGIEFPGGPIPFSAFTIPHYPKAPYFIRNYWSIPEGSAVTVEPGAILKFDLGKRLTVSGSLTAIGTESSRITFTSIRDDEAGGDTNNDGLATTPAASNWDWVEFGPNSSAVFDYATLRYGGGTIGTGYHGVLFAKHFVIPEVREHVLLTKNWMNAIHLPGGVMSLSKLLLPHQLAAPYYISDYLTVPAGSTMTVAAGSILKVRNGILVDGAFRILGAPENPVIVTSTKDDVGGDTNGDGASAPAGGDWGEIVFRDSSDDSLSLIEYAIIRYGGGFRTGSVHIVDSSPTIRYSLITRNADYGIFTSSSLPSLVCNDLVENAANGLFNATPGTVVNAENQWWGSANGPYHPDTNPAGAGDRVSDGVDFTPWSTSPCVSADLPPIPPGDNRLYLPTIHRP